MNVLNRMMSYDKNKKSNEICNCENCNPIIEQIIEYSPLSEEEIEQIIKERYSDKDEKTKIFIRKALRVHGDRYDYSNVVYVKNNIKVEIICRVEGHKPFQQTPHAHKRGQGCSACKGGVKITTEEFIKRAKEIHGEDTYDYSKVKYVNADTDVIIICNNHNEPYEFKQSPSNHLQGHGCELCGIEKRANKRRKLLETFIMESNKIHDEGRYDYSKVVYINNDTNVIIICNNHDEPYEFPQTPRGHLQGQGCPLCNGGVKITTEEFIKRANNVHGEGTYDYSKVDYIDAFTNIIIICNNHDEPYEFPQLPTNHLKGEGCDICGGTKKLTTEEFIEKANEVHGEGTYDYSKVDYINNHTDVIIICPKHGDFPQKPNDHLQGHGCSKCTNKYKGEIAIRKFLTEKGIEFEEQKKFEGCKYKQLLRFDFYVPKYNLCIEFDGAGHFQKIKWNKEWTEKRMEEELKLNQLRDQIKNEYCKNNGIGLLRLNNLKTVKEDIIKYFQDNNLLK